MIRIVLIMEANITTFIPNAAGTIEAPRQFTIEDKPSIQKTIGILADQIELLMKTPMGDRDEVINEIIRDSIERKLRFLKIIETL